MVLRFNRRMTRIRVLHREVELIPEKSGRKSKDQRKPCGDAIPQSLSLQYSLCDQHRAGNQADRNAEHGKVSVKYQVSSVMSVDCMSPDTRHLTPDT
jgi:hypothetical protein